MLGGIYKYVLLDFHRHREISEHLQRVCKMTQGSCLKLKCWVHWEKISVFNRLLWWATGLSSLREVPGADAECLKHECYILLKDILMFTFMTMM